MGQLTIFRKLREWVKKKPLNLCLLSNLHPPLLPLSLTALCYFFLGLFFFIDYVVEYGYETDFVKMLAYFDYRNTT